MSFKTKKTFIERKTESFNIMNKYPDRIPIICEKNTKHKNTPEIDKIKYLVPNDLTVGHFMYVIRKRIKLNSDQGIFLFINNTIPSTTNLLSILYSIYKEDDGFLYITYSTENTFG
jgi:GABA(A) receptor-associated protein